MSGSGWLIASDRQANNKPDACHAECDQGIMSLLPMLLLLLSRLLPAVEGCLSVP